jgi:hypothetical protein
LCYVCDWCPGMCELMCGIYYLLWYGLLLMLWLLWCYVLRCLIVMFLQMNFWSLQHERSAQHGGSFQSNLYLGHLLVPPSVYSFASQCIWFYLSMVSDLSTHWTQQVVSAIGDPHLLKLGWHQNSHHFIILVHTFYDNFYILCLIEEVIWKEHKSKKVNFTGGMKKHTECEQT